MLCPSCQRENRIGASFCDGCGAALRAAAAPAPLLASQASGDGFVGRGAELARLFGSLDQAAQSRGQIWMVAGEPGIGKTRVAQRVALEAGTRALQVLWGRCKEEPGAPPYWPWVQAIDAYVAQHDDATVRAMLGRGATYIAEIAPSVAERCADLPTLPRANDPDQARFQLFDALTSFWKRVAGAGGLVLILDNLHCADAASLRFLEFFASEADGERLMVLGTYRDIELTRQHAMSNTLGELARHAWAYRMKLSGLTFDESAQLVGAIAGAEAPSELLATLFSQTEGNPLFLQEMTRYLAQEGLLGREGTTAVMPTTPRRIPEGIREVIGTRLNRLSKSANDVLGCAAVIGRTFRPELLTRVIEGIRADDCLVALEQAEAMRIVEPGHEAGSYQFTHALIRETLYDELSAVRRSRLHQRVAESLELMRSPREMTALAAIAHHFCAALPGGDVDKAIDYARRAAERANILTAYEESARLYRLALQAQEATSNADPIDRARLLLALGESLTKAGEHVEARDTFRQVAVLLSDNNSADALQIRAQAAIGFEDASWRPGEHGGLAVRFLRETLECLDPGDSLLRARMLSALTRALVHTGDVESANSANEQAIAIARRLGDRATLASALVAGVGARWQADRIHVRIANGREAYRLAIEAGDEVRAVEAMSFYTFDLLESGELHLHVNEFREFERLVGLLRLPFYQYVILTSNAGLALFTGRFDEAERLAEEAFSRGQRQPGIDALGVYGVQMFSIRREQGRLREVAPIVKRIVSGTPEAATWRPGLALIYAELDMREQARALFEQLAHDEFCAIARDALWITSVGYLAEVCAYLGDDARASVLYRLLAPYQTFNLVTGSNLVCVGSVERHLGMLAATMKRIEEADRHFSAAASMNERQGALPWLAHTRHQHAAMLLDRNRSQDRARAIELADQALAVAKALGMKMLEERLSLLGARIGTSQARGANPARLSDREVAVLKLVAIGRSNREIGKALFVSENTVANHVRNILAKTETANRTEAAAFARENRLA